MVSDSSAEVSVSYGGCLRAIKVFVIVTLHEPAAGRNSDLFIMLR